MESFLGHCLKSIHVKGTIHPSKASEAILKKLAGDKFEMGKMIDAAGGFVFVAEKEERDCTFEFLVREALRPSTEVEAAHTLFPSDK